MAWQYFPLQHNENNRLENFQQLCPLIKLLALTDISRQ
jgi:hypothetical protein